MDRRIAASFLASHGWLSATPDDFRNAILEASAWRNFEVGESLIVAGDPPGGIFGIASGSASAFTAFGAPDSPMVHLGAAGIWTGEGCILTGEPRRVTIVVKAPMFAAYVSLPDLHSLLASRPEWWRHIGQLAQRTVDILVSGVADTMIRDPTRRCAALLLRLAGSRFSDTSDIGNPEVRLIQDELAAMSSLSRSSVSAIVRRLGDRGLIEVRFGSIAIVDAQGLRKIANGD